MKTVLRIIDKKQGSFYHDIPNPYNMTPRKDDTITWEQQNYIVSYVEFDFDENTLYIVVII